MMTGLDTDAYDMGIGIGLRFMYWREAEWPMSAYGYKQTYRGQLANVRFTPKSGHSEAQERIGLKKRTSNVRFAPNSGHKWVSRWMSAFDPLRSFRHARIAKSFNVKLQVKFIGVRRVGGVSFQGKTRVCSHYLSCRRARFFFCP